MGGGGDTFLQQFMAGWQMGQQRREGQRRDQMMMQQQQQEAQRMQADAQERAARIEALKLQKDRIEWERKREELDLKLRVAPLLSNQTQTLPPQTEDLGGGTTMNLGAMTTPKPPIMADIPGMGQVPLPSYEDIQERKRKEEEAELAKFTAQEGVKAQFRPPQRPVSVAPGGRLVDPDTGEVVFTAPERPEPGEPGGMNPKQKANFLTVTNKFQSDKAIENANNSKVAQELADQVIANPGTAANQLITVYSLIKNLDQGSAVKEGETALLQSTLSYVARYQNAFDKLTKNQLIPPETAKEFAEATKRLADQWIKVGNRKVSSYKAQAKGLGIQEPFETYLTESGIDTPVSPGGGYEATTVPGVRRRKVQR